MPELDCFCAYEPTPVMCPEHGVVRGFEAPPDEDGNEYVLYGDQAALVVKEAR